MNNLKSKLLKALMGVSLGALGAFVVTFVIYFWNLDMKLTSVMEDILLKHYVYSAQIVRQLRQHL